MIQILNFGQLPLIPADTFVATYIFNSVKASSIYHTQAKAKFHFTHFAVKIF